MRCLGSVKQMPSAPTQTVRGSSVILTTGRETKTQCSSTVRSRADAAQHIEAGGCPNCPGGKEEAREAIFKYVARCQDTQRLLAARPQRFGRVPDHPYECTHCNRQSANIGSIMKHEESCHGNNIVVLGKGFRKFIQNYYRARG